MPREYLGVTVRFLRRNERLIPSKSNEMPLVIQANGANDVKFLQEFLTAHSSMILEDIANYGAVLLRGFAITSDEEFEKTILSIQGLQGISEAFMSEEGRIHTGDLNYVLHTNAVYKTGGTLYLGGFHTENYYSPDVPSYISFCCFKPSLRGGETGLVNMEAIYEHLSEDLKARLEQSNFFVGKWLVSEVASRYKISVEDIEKTARYFDLPIIGKENNQFILMYKPSVAVHPHTKKKSLQINLFELVTLNAAMRKCFLTDYQGKEWFWHRLVWRMPEFVLKILEFFYVITASFFYSPLGALKIILAKYKAYRATNKIKEKSEYNRVRVGSCFDKEDIENLAQLIRDNYSSCLWEKGDILLVDNRKVAHAGMPGSGPRLVRAMICNPLDMKYSFLQTGVLQCKERMSDSIGSYMMNLSRDCQEAEKLISAP